jgi:hypothetical protein
MHTNQASIAAARYAVTSVREPIAHGMMQHRYVVCYQQLHTTCARLAQQQHNRLYVVDNRGGSVHLAGNPFKERGNAQIYTNEQLLKTSESK